MCLMFRGPLKSDSHVELVITLTAGSATSMFIATWFTLGAHAQEGYGTCLGVCNSSINIVRFYSPNKVCTAFV